MWLETYFVPKSYIAQVQIDADGSDIILNVTDQVYLSPNIIFNPKLEETGHKFGLGSAIEIQICRQASFRSRLYPVSLIHIINLERTYSAPSKTLPRHIRISTA